MSSSVFLMGKVLNCGEITLVAQDLKQDNSYNYVMEKTLEMVGFHSKFNEEGEGYG